MSIYVLKYRDTLGLMTFLIIFRYGAVRCKADFKVTLCTVRGAFKL